ncbi:MAG TPA: T9SS type A sorting domain-containing protein [bacterium (Candidatus Stahlbacteria)]|nr:T9SS type A sorting domain-containing protein [Candidatus Stahlbacteria bacterium]
MMMALLAIFISSPGDSVGWTKWDVQWASGQTGWQVWYDGSCTHVDFVEAHGPISCRGCAYNFKRADNWLGSMKVNSEVSNYATIGIKPFNNAAVCCYHMWRIGDIYRSWVAVDETQGGYVFTERPVLPQNTTDIIIWPRLAVDDRGNFHVVMHGYTMYMSFYTRSTDDGVSWSDTLIINPDTGYCINESSGVFADRFDNPGKIIIYWTRWTGEGSMGVVQHAQDIWYMVSTDYGETWGGKINITNYQPSDTMRAFCHVKAIIDRDGDPHIVFPTLYFVNQTPYNRSWIMHWSPKTGFSVVTGPHRMTNVPGAWRLPCDFPNISLDRDNGWLYCTYVLNRDSDISQGGWPNGEIMGKYSTDNGLSWISAALGDTGVNLTKTPTPGAPPGECCDDDYPSIHPYVEKINDKKHLIISYLEDKDAGSYIAGEGTETDNPYRVYFCPAESIIGVSQKHDERLTDLRIPGLIYGNLLRLSGLKDPARVKILDVLGREVITQTVSPQHTSIDLSHLTSGVYFLLVGKDRSGLHKFVLIR